MRTALTRLHPESRDLGALAPGLQRALDDEKPQRRTLNVGPDWAARCSWDAAGEDLHVGVAGRLRRVALASGEAA